MAEQEQQESKAAAAELEKRIAELEADRDKWKDLSRKHEARSKENADAAAKAAAADEKSKSVEEQLAALQKRADEAEARAMRAQVAQEKGLTAAQAKRLSGSTLEELTADADDLLESFKPGKADGSSGTGAEDDEGKSSSRAKPKEKLRSGASSVDSSEDESLAATIAKIPRADA